MGLLNNEAAEKEADKIAFKFQNSNDVMRDMSRAYNTDFSDIRIHTDGAADAKVRAVGRDAIASGRDIFFGKGIYESNDPESNALVAHELAHTMQQGSVMSEGAVSESAPMGAEQGGLRSKFREWRERRRIRKANDKRAKEGNIPTSNEERSNRNKWNKGRKVVWDSYVGLTNTLSDTENDDVKAEFLTQKQKADSASTIEDALFALKPGEHAMKAESKVFGDGRNYLAYFDELNRSNIDYKMLDEERKKRNQNETNNFDVKSDSINMADDLLASIGRNLNTEDGKNYFDFMVDNLKDAKVFENGEINSIDYLLSEVYYNQIDKIIKMYNETKGETEDKERDTFTGDAIYVLKMIPQYANMNGEERKQLPDVIKNLCTRYDDIKNNMISHIKKNEKKKIAKSQNEAWNNERKGLLQLKKHSNKLAKRKYKEMKAKFSEIGPDDLMDKLENSKSNEYKELDSVLGRYIVDDINFREYFNKMDEYGIDDKSADLLNIRKNRVDDISSDFMDMIGNGLKSEKGQKFLKFMTDRIKGAKAFDDKENNPLDYMIDKVFSRRANAIRVLTTRVSGKDGKLNPERNKLVNAATGKLGKMQEIVDVSKIQVDKDAVNEQIDINAAAIASGETVEYNDEANRLLKLSESNILSIDPKYKELYLKYQNLKKEISELMLNRKSGAN